MKKRDIGFLVLGSLFAIVCIRLGFWQLSRLYDRREFNKELLARAETPPVTLDKLPTDSGEAHFRRVSISGEYDFDHEVYLIDRTRNGSPGVNILTPLKSSTSDTAVLVNRGWVYSPDAMTVDLSKWREPAKMQGEAYVENFTTRQGVARSRSQPRGFRWAEKAAISQAFPYPIEPYYLVLIGGKTPANVPPRVDVPALDEGPHQSYAIQWFAFATIAIVGMILYARRK